MRVLTVHNYPGNYATGGEGTVFEDETALLRAHYHEVRQYKCTNAEITQAGLFKRIKAFVDAPWSKKGYQVIREEIEKFAPDIMHVHNFFFMLSPSIFRAAKDAGVPTVVTLHNFRLISPCSQLLRDGHICELCLNKNPWRIMFYRCYQKSFLANLLRYKIYYSGEKKYKWIDDIDAFIALTEFGKRKYIEGGLPGHRIYVKPNFYCESGRRDPPQTVSHGAIFVGRISREKGIKTLLDAWRGVEYPLTIVGDGPQMAAVVNSATKNVRFVGMKSHDDAIKAIKEAAFLIFPSECYEGFPLTILEAMATGRAILASDLGPRSEMVKDEVSGLLFKAGDPHDLREKAKWLIEHPEACADMGRASREEYLLKYTENINYEMLHNIYKKTIDRHLQSATIF